MSFNSIQYKKFPIQIFISLSLETQTFKKLKMVLTANQNSIVNDLFS